MAVEERSGKDPESLKAFREKRKWQIALRRYVLEKAPSQAYAPYFGLDNGKFRDWIALQFSPGISWEDFGQKWQFDHIIPVTYFDFEDEGELRLCWNFINIRVEETVRNKNRGHRLDVLAARSYFSDLFSATGYDIAGRMVEKIERIELSELVNTTPLKDFIKVNRDYLRVIQSFSAHEYELLNQGRTLAEVEEERDFLRRIRTQ